MDPFSDQEDQKDPESKRVLARICLEAKAPEPKTESKSDKAKTTEAQGHAKAKSPSFSTCFQYYFNFLVLDALPATSGMSSSRKKRCCLTKSCTFWNDS